MQATDPTLGLRERKKIRTRETIRREAFRLIEENGYAATTVEQIAEAAEVSPSTFFRYFPTKESVLLADDMDPAFLDALVSPASRSVATESNPPRLPGDHRQHVGGPTGVRGCPATADVLDTRAQGGHVRRVLPHHHIDRRGSRMPESAVTLEISSCRCSRARLPARSWQPTIPVRARRTPFTAPWTSSTPVCL